MKGELIRIDAYACSIPCLPPPKGSEFPTNSDKKR